MVIVEPESLSLEEVPAETFTAVRVEHVPTVDWMRSWNTNCIVCGGQENLIHCKLRCRNCGATRDCSDP